MSSPPIADLSVPPKAVSTALAETTLLCRAKDSGNNEHKQGSKKRSSPAALHSLLKFLVSIAGKRILALFALSIARTALSNRLARLQVID